MIAKHSIENLKNHLDVVDIVSQFLEIKKSGANFKACCPFHGEKTPSLVISPAKQIFHCFGCGIGGDAITFVMEHEKLSYPEALEKLSSMVNVPLVYENSSHVTYNIKILESLNQFYQKNFIHHISARAYIEKRGLSSFSIQKFELGYAGPSRETIHYLKQGLFNLVEAKELGTIDKGENGLYARLIERITFPIYSISGKIVGFGGRTISGHNAKYINSPQTKLFNKSKLLYGYHLAKQTIYKKKEIIITEGYLDVIMLHQAGFDQSVATLGTALTTDHLPLLKRGEPKVILAYDGDKAGLNAAYKASVLLSHSQFEGGVVLFDANSDPADMVQEGQIERLNRMFSTAKPFIPFVIDFLIQSHNLSDPLSKEKALKESTEYLKTLTPILQEEYARYIASKLNISEKHIVIKHNSPLSTGQINTFDVAELSIVKTILEDPKHLNTVLKYIDGSVFVQHKQEFEYAIENRDHPSLRSILLNDKLEVYDDKRLTHELSLLLFRFYEKKLLQIKYDTTLSEKKRMHRIRELRLYLSELKKGKIQQRVL